MGAHSTKRDINSILWSRYFHPLMYCNMCTCAWSARVDATIWEYSRNWMWVLVAIIFRSEAGFQNMIPRIQQDLITPFYYKGDIKSCPAKQILMWSSICV